MIAKDQHCGQRLRLGAVMLKVLLVGTGHLPGRRCGLSVLESTAGGKTSEGEAGDGEIRRFVAARPASAQAAHHAGVWKRSF